MGSLGRLLQPYGDMPFEEAVGQFREAALAALSAGADLILIETMTDLLETKAALLGARRPWRRPASGSPFLQPHL